MEYKLQCTVAYAGLRCIKYKYFALKRKYDSMGIISNFREVIRASIHPGGNTKEMGIGDALRYYYTALPMPIVLLALAAAIVFAVSFLQSFFGGLLAGTVVAVAFVYVLISLLLYPIFILIDTAIVHFFSKILFKIIKGPIEKTYAAFIYGGMPMLMLSWLLLILFTFLPQSIAYGLSSYQNSLSIPGIVLILILGIWVAAVAIISLAKQHNVSIVRAFLAYIVPVIILVAIMLALEAPLLLGIGHKSLLPKGATCIATSGYSCANPTVALINSVRTLSVTVGQATGATWYPPGSNTSIEFYLVPYNVSFTNASTPGSIESSSSVPILNSVELQTITFSHGIGNYFSGNIYAVYATSQGGSAMYTNIAMVTIEPS